jgi:hypothetical protein
MQIAAILNQWSLTQSRVAFSAARRWRRAFPVRGRANNQLDRIKEKNKGSELAPTFLPLQEVI